MTERIRPPAFDVGEREPRALLAQLGPFAARLQAAKEARVNAQRALAAAEVELSAARDEFELTADTVCRIAQ